MYPRVFCVNIPCLVPPKVRIVQQDAHQFGDRHRGMGVVKLDRDFLRKLVPVGVVAPKAADQVSQRASDQEILLHKAQTLPHAGGIVGIQHPGE